MAKFNGEVRQHHRLAAGERITGMKHGGYVKRARYADGGQVRKDDPMSDEDEGRAYMSHVDARGTAAALRKAINDPKDPENKDIDEDLRRRKAAWGDDPDIDRFQKMKPDEALAKRKELFGYRSGGVVKKGKR